MSDTITSPESLFAERSAGALTPAAGHEFILTLSCPDRRGIVSTVSSYLNEGYCNILDSAQFGDSNTGRFFMRVHFSAPELATVEQLTTGFKPLADSFDMNWRLVDRKHKPRLLIMVSKLGHCLNDLLYRFRSGALHAQIAGVVSNHPDFEVLVRAHGIPFHHLPVTSATKRTQEARLLELIQSENVALRKFKWVPAGYAGLAD